MRTRTPAMATLSTMAATPALPPGLVQAKVVMDMAGGRITRLIHMFGGLPGIATRHVTAPWAEVRADVTRRALSVRMPLSVLRANLR